MYWVYIDVDGKFGVGGVEFEVGDVVGGIGCYDGGW